MGSSKDGGKEKSRLDGRGNDPRARAMQNKLRQQNNAKGKPWKGA